MQSNEPPVSPAFDDDVNAVVDRGVNRAPEGSPQVAPEGNAPAPAFEDEADAFGGSLTGRRIAHYVVEEKMGGGAMATVYRAHDTILDRMVALKVLMPRADETTRERFRREARTAVTLEHPNIVQGYQVGQIADEGAYYIVMELVTGPSLSDLLERQGRLSSAEACALLAPIAQALHYAHTRGIIHRDVKPSNILLQAPSAARPHAVKMTGLEEPVVPLLSDFGIARALDAPELTSAGRTIGTPAFMSPEQCAGDEEIDGRADIYSLGAVLYRCLVGRAPFAGSTTQILHAHVYDPLLIPNDVVDALPEAAMAVLRHSMMKQPAERYASAQEMSRDLAAAALAPAPVAATDATAGEADATRTLASLPVADGGRTTSSQILVPARPVARPTIPMAEGVRPPVRRREVTPMSSPRVAQGTRGVGRNRLGVILLGVALTALVAMMAITLMTGVLPTLRSERGAGTAAAGAVAVVPEQTADPSLTSQPGATGDEPGDGPGAAPVQATATEEAAGVGDDAAGETPSVEATPSPPLEASLDYAWETAQVFFDERDWGEAVTWLVAVQRIDPEFEKGLVASMLGEAFMGQAALAIRAGQLDEAQAELQKAVEILPDFAVVTTLRDAVSNLSQADPEEERTALRSLRTAFLGYANALVAEGRTCDAAIQAGYAYDLLANPQVLETKQAYDAACIEETREETLTTMTGSLLFSSVEGQQYRIFRLPVGVDARATLLIENGAQPALDPTGTMVAFFSLRSDMQGLAGFDLTRGLDPNERSVRYTNFVEDARDSPPSWSPQGDRLVFASTRFGDGRSRVYITEAGEAGATTELGFGKDPAWHPSADLIVMNGTDETGNAPGLWLMRPDGSGRQRLTDNGNDQRPAWTPDGSAVVFMSNGRDDNWELYRVDLADGGVARLTVNTAQDGLPSVSPDGAYVAFMSDRDGYWRVWFVPIDGGDSLPLANIPGELPKWLEHAVQWVK